MVFTEEFSGHFFTLQHPHTKKKKKNSVYRLFRFNPILGNDFNRYVINRTHIMWWCSTCPRASHIPGDGNCSCELKRRGAQEADSAVACVHRCRRKCPLLRGWVKKPNKDFEEMIHACADLETIVVQQLVHARPSSEPCRAHTVPPEQALVNH